MHFELEKVDLLLLLLNFYHQLCFVFDQVVELALRRLLGIAQVLHLEVVQVLEQEPVRLRAPLERLLDAGEASLVAFRQLLYLPVPLLNLSVQRPKLDFEEVIFCTFRPALFRQLELELGVFLFEVVGSLDDFDVVIEGAGEVFTESDVELHDFLDPDEGLAIF